MLCWLVERLPRFSPRHPLRSSCLLLALGWFSVAHAQLTTSFGVTAPSAPAAPAVQLTPLEAATKLLRHGDYAEAFAAGQAGAKADIFNAAWWLLQGDALMATGKYEEAYAILTDNLRYVPNSLPMLLLIRQCCLYTGRDAEATRTLKDITSRLTGATPASRSPEFLTEMGQAALLIGAEPKLILENFLKPGQQSTPPIRTAFLAAGGLALDKHDDALASRTFLAGQEKFPDDADMLWGLAMAYRASDAEKVENYVKQALAANPNHTPTKLLLAEHAIDGEDYAAAKARLDTILAIDPTQPDALALLSVIASLHNDAAGAAEARTRALATWKTNPRVDHLIGEKLAQHYRFKEAAVAERQSLAFDENYIPARIQLAQDELRLGQEEAGWKDATAANKADGYDTEAFNLMQLHDQIEKFKVISNPHFLVRMAPNEAAIYGDRVLALLERARATLTAKYGMALDEQVTIEIYPEPADFSVRTFGMPDIGGFLGVTFGSVVTINSPSTQNADWEAVLWHEFTHVITLTLTNNRMPRWLSEGISVYEERQANPAWGMLMSIKYRDEILGGKMHPISDMSSAFLKAKDGRDIVFAYFESSLVVQFLVERYGMDHLKELLRGLGADEEINASFAKHVAPIAELDTGFAKYATDLATQMGGNLDLTHPAADSPDGAIQLMDPRNFYVRLQQVQKLFADEKWAEARDALKKLTDGGHYLAGANNPLMLLAMADAKLGDVAGEKAALTTVAEHEADLLEPVSQLMALAEKENDWVGMARWGEAWLAINPVAATPWRKVLTADEHQSKSEEAVRAARVLLQLDPPDLASIHYRLAKQLQATDIEAARRHVLQALDLAPRFRAAYELLAALPPIAPSATPPPANPTPPPGTAVSPSAPVAPASL